MEINLTRTERVIALIAFVAISLFFGMFLKLNRGAKSSPQFDTGSAINYTMARPDQAYSEYTLAGRELDHTFEGLPTERTEAKLEKNKNELITKKVAEAKKKDEIKKKQAVQAKAQVQAQSKLKEMQTRTSKPQLANNKTKSASVSEGNQQSNNSYTSHNNVAQIATPAVQKDPKANKKTYAEWRSSLFANPTPENLALFIAALRKNELSITEFQYMAQDLVDQSDLKLKGLGLMALRSMPSLASLSQLAHLPAALGNYQAYVDQSLMAYLQPQNLQFLNQALLTQDKVLIVKSLNLLSTNLTKFSQGDFSGLVDPRNRREGEVVTFSMVSYRTLLPVLSQLGSSEDQDLSAIAQQITTLIQTYNNVAQN